ncbi:Uncharacterised protein [Salmonella enterica subsp. enterica serovar Typhimurium]|nr:Uncharacterised protein [Salmonella enterica subsp. enterica serovar Montevideo]SUH91991.1 Uncharacterised protein [Salmonella enterica subsp. enterica serovar Typhimurium]
MSVMLHSNSADLFDSLTFPPGNLITSKTSRAPSIPISQRPFPIFELEQSTSQDTLTPSINTKSSVFAGTIETSGVQCPISLSSPASRRHFLMVKALDGSPSLLLRIWPFPVDNHPNETPVSRAQVTTTSPGKKSRLTQVLIVPEDMPNKSPSSFCIVKP